MFENKCRIIFVQGFGFSGSSAIAEFLSICSGNDEAYIRESVLLKSFFLYSYAVYSGKKIRFKKKNKLLSNIMAVDDRADSVTEAYSSSALLTKASIDKCEYKAVAEKLIKSLGGAELTQDSRLRKKIVVDAATEFFLYLSSKIEYNLGVCVYDNLINAHLGHWLKIIDLERVGAVAVYTVYRRNLKDQFYEQVLNSRAHSTKILRDLKNVALYFIFRIKGAGLKNDRKNSANVSILPTGVHRVLNKYTAAFFWKLYLSDLRNRVDAYMRHPVSFGGNRIFLNRLICFEDLVGDDEVFRSMLHQDLSTISRKRLDENRISKFRYKKSQRNINKYRLAENNLKLEGMIPGKMYDLTRMERFR